MLLGDGEVTDDSVGVDRDLEAAERSERATARARPRDERASSGKPVEVHVLRHGQRRDEREFLVEGRDTKCLGRVRVAEVDDAAAVQNLALVRLIRPREALRQGGLPAPVLADECVDLPRAQNERGPVDSSDAGEHF